jgi:hypothetical protein
MKPQGRGRSAKDNGGKGAGEKKEKGKRGNQKNSIK